MPKNHLPTYAIVELLIRLSVHNPAIGNYKTHNHYESEVLVRTTSGTIVLSHQLVLMQFERPEQITDAELATLSGTFNPLN
jgi:hypothetical protein